MASGDWANRLGTYVAYGTGGERYGAYVPPPLPPDPPLQLGRLYSLMEQANQALGRLDGVTSVLPDTALFIYMYVRKEALLSSQIEGTQSSFFDLLLFECEETPSVPLDDVREVSDYVAAMNHGLERLRGGFPLSLRLIREIHRILLAKGRGRDRNPGEFRRSQNWIGGTRPGNAHFVPPPPDRLTECLGDFEKFLHRETPDIPVLVKAALAHVQFETIHPFLDGNGRVGRLLITLLLCIFGALREPILYLSLYFKTHRARYYELLQQVREKGDWESWVEFFLSGVRETSNQAAEAGRRILSLVEEDRSRIERLGRPAASALRLHQLMQTHPLVSIPKAAESLSLSAPTVAKSIRHLQELGVLREITGRKRGRLFVYKQYLDILDQGTEPLPR